MGHWFDSIDLRTCKMHLSKLYSLGFTKCSNPSFAFILNLIEKFFNHNNVKNGIWNKPQGSTLINKNIGIIGLGNIGSRISEMLMPFKCKIFGNDIKKLT